MSPERHKDQEPRKEPLRFGIAEETDKLKTVAVWGNVGAEASLAQLFPPEISLFYDHMDVPEARRECVSFITTLRNNYGIETIEVRDELAKTITPKKYSRQQIQQGLLQKAEDIVAKHGTKLSSQQLRDNRGGMLALLEEDIAKYGPDQALTLNHTLSLTRELPLGDALYARDQMNVLLGKRIIASMAKDIRKPEVGFYEKVYRSILEKGNEVILPLGEHFEGGDAYVHDGIVYIGVGTRTTIGAVEHIYWALATEINEKGFQLAVVIDPDPFQKSQEDQMESMHLDTFSMPAGPNQMLVCEVEAIRRTVSIARQNGPDIEFVSTGKNFMEYLEDRGEEIIILPKEEQQCFGANLLVIDSNNILVPLDSNEKTISQLTRTGKNIVNLDLAECTKGYGAAHCMTGQLLREPE